MSFFAFKGGAKILAFYSLQQCTRFQLAKIYKYTCIRSSGLPVGSHSIVGWRAQKNGHRLAASPYWITSSDLALGVI